MAEPFLRVKGLQKQFSISTGLFGWGARKVDAVSGVTFEISKGETLAVVGESGCGKSTVGRCILKLVDSTSGEIYLDGSRIDILSNRRLGDFRRKVQVVFQDPFSSLNPRLRIRDVLAEPLRNFGLYPSAKQREARIAELLSMVGLPAESADRWPHEFSGGQRQRIGIARALATEPEIVICDEAVSALDVSVKAQIVNLLRDLQKRTGVAFLFISHDLAIVENIAHRVAVMYLGKIVEVAPTKDLIADPHHPYSEALLSAVPIPDPRRRRAQRIIEGEIPSPANPPKGCRFNTRCPFVFDRCRREEPPLTPAADGRLVACHLKDLPEARAPRSIAASS